MHEVWEFPVRLLAVMGIILVVVMVVVPGRTDEAPGVILYFFPPLPLLHPVDFETLLIQPF